MYFINKNTFIHTLYIHSKKKIHAFINAFSHKKKKSFKHISYMLSVSTSGLLWWFDEANQVKMFKIVWSYVECMKISWRLKTWC